MYKEILLKLEIIESELVDAYNTGHDGEINSDSLHYIDCAKDELYELKQLIEQKISREEKDHKELYNIK